jgi:transposase InsO family protein
VLGVPRASYYTWKAGRPSPRAVQDAGLTGKIRQVHKASRGTYGAPRIHAELRLAQGIRVSRKRVARLMASGWRSAGRPPGRRATGSCSRSVQSAMRRATAGRMWDACLAGQKVASSEAIAAAATRTAIVSQGTGKPMPVPLKLGSFSNSR